MHIERMHKMIECLCEKAWSKMENGLECVDTAEMGQVHYKSYAEGRERGRRRR